MIEYILPLGHEGKTPLVVELLRKEGYRATLYQNDDAVFLMTTDAPAATVQRVIARVTARRSSAETS